MSAKKLKVHFLGIGGIGVSALARYYLAQGHKVSGSDLASSEITQGLQKLGIKISIGKNKIPKNADLVIYSPAVNVRHLVSNISILSYPEALGELTKKYFTIAVSGTHGKSTTTALLSLILIKAGLDPTIIIGAKLKELNDTNFRTGKSKYLIIEADEHMASFLNYWPKMIVLTNINADHLDYYKNLKNIIKTFKEYIGHLPKDGVLIANKDDKNVAKISTIARNLANFSLKQPEAKKLKRILKVPGEHNIYNALAALTAARTLKIPDKISFQALSQYKGAWRRFEIIQTRPYVLISDYGHNPQKALATLKAAREKYPRKRIWCVYQPHQYQRTYYLFREFVSAFRKAPVDNLIITDIFDVAGRETTKVKKKVSSEKLAKATDKKNTIYIPKDKILDYLKKMLARRSPKGECREVLIIMGAGDIYELIPKLKT